jgi:hypothetical protein
VAELYSRIEILLSAISDQFSGSVLGQVWEMGFYSDRLAWAISAAPANTLAVINARWVAIS